MNQVQQDISRNTQWMPLPHIAHSFSDPVPHCPNSSVWLYSFAILVIFFGLCCMLRDSKTLKPLLQQDATPWFWCNLVITVSLIDWLSRILLYVPVFRMLPVLKLYRGTFVLVLSVLWLYLRHKPSLKKQNNNH
eukprot:TRINITY_DN10464_c0_g1_i1.p1 TRINITY_DN10464_c0_g1~~TRINITY_DN10464_c0_g1_i1.p1  ORF type:complete len:134 (+),score=10.18 TRINITY_DN10464_c0_g1_i1:122-523(+)